MPYIERSDKDAYSGFSIIKNTNLPIYLQAAEAVKGVTVIKSDRQTYNNGGSLPEGLVAIQVIHTVDVTDLTPFGREVSRLEREANQADTSE